MVQEKYPVGTQSFETLIKDKCVYVDKTKYIYDLVNMGSDSYVLSRPRRFGKSLFLSTLEAYFKGQRELFEGLAIYDLEKEWKSYPVLHFDFSDNEVNKPSKLKKDIRDALEEIASTYGITLNFKTGIGRTFSSLIKEIVKKTGQKVVILIDEYDKGIVEVLDDQIRLEQNQNILRPFFSVIKSQNNNIHFCFITGITRFRHYTLFSGANSLNDLSMHGDFASICGITMEELLQYFPQGIKKLCDNWKMSHEEVVDALKQKYDGNRFTYKDILVFNPFDLLNCFYKGIMENYWIKSGTSKVFFDYITKQNDFDITTLINLWVSQDRMEGTFKEDDPIPLLFQTGYLTIRDFDSGLYRLDIPNGEVRKALVEEILPHYLGVDSQTITLRVVELKKIVESGDIEALIDKMTSYIAGIPYHLFDYDNNEKTYHLAIYSMFSMIDVDVKSEFNVSGGRIDMVVKARKYIYVMGFELDRPAQDALDQIDTKRYTLKWNDEKGKKVIKVGVSFSSEIRNIVEWKAV